MSDKQTDALATRERFVPKAYGVLHPIVVDHAEGAHVTDETGRRYIDFAGGIAVVNVGHRAPAVVEAVRKQIDKNFHTGPVTANRPSIELARRLALQVGSQGERQTLLVNSGAEAVENAVKLARHATGRAAVIAFDRSFHGRTLLTASLTGKTHPHKTQPGAMAPEVYHAPYPYPLRPPAGVDPNALVSYTIDILNGMLDTRVALENVAAVIVEPIQGEGGFIVPPSGFLSQLAEWCRERHILLIVDEIQTGYGRTGRFFAFEHEGIDPDIVTVGKSVADGLPLAAVIAGRELWDRVFPGDVGGTFAGNPIACAAGLAVLDMFEDGTLLARAVSIGERIRRRLTGLIGHPRVAEVRGVGAMNAIEFVTNRETLKPDPVFTADVIRVARERGLLVIQTGIWANSVRLLPPFIATDETVDEALEILFVAIDAASNKSSAIREGTPAQLRA